MARLTASKTLKKIESIESTIQKQYKGKAQSKKALDAIFKLQSMSEYKKVLKDIAEGTAAQSEKASIQAKSILSFREAEQFVTQIAKVSDNIGTDALDEVTQRFTALRNLDPKAAQFTQDLLFSEYWGKLISASGKSEANKISQFKQWADSWSSAKLKENGDEHLKILFGNDTYKGLDDLALTLKGALDIDSAAGALSVAESVPSFLRKILNRDVKGSFKPLSFMYLTKQFAPGSPRWIEMNKRLSGGSSIDDLVKEQSGSIKKVFTKVQSMGENILTGRNGLMAASVANYMEDANQIYPMEGEVDAQPKKTYVEQEAIAEEQAIAQAAAPDQAVAQQELGQNMMALLQSAQNAGPQPQAAPMQQPARGVPNAPIAPQAPAVPLSINASSIPNSFANLMGSINLSGRG